MRLYPITFEVRPSGQVKVDRDDEWVELWVSEIPDDHTLRIDPESARRLGWRLMCVAEELDPELS